MPVRKYKGKPTETPIINQMQGLFIDNNFCLDFYKTIFPREIKKSKEKSYTTHLGKMEVKVILENPIGDQLVCNKNFSKDGVSVAFQIGIEYEQIKEAYNTENFHNVKQDDLSETYLSEEVRVEIIPTISDDYPIILQEMQKFGANVLFIKEYNGSGISEDAFKEIFEHQGIRVVFEKQLESAVF